MRTKGIMNGRHEAQEYEGGKGGSDGSQFDRQKVRYKAGGEPLRNLGLASPGPTPELPSK